jgi:hypothetical protein
VPLIYGEGKEGVFVRLHDEIDKSSKSKHYRSSSPSSSQRALSLSLLPILRKNISVDHLLWKTAKSKMSTAKYPSTTVQQASREYNNTATRSPDWLKPVVMMPSQDFESNAQLVDPFIHPIVAEVIFSNCRAACFDFYRTNGLWRTKYGRGDIDEPKLFQLVIGDFP